MRHMSREQEISFRWLCENIFDLTVWCYASQLYCTEAVCGAVALFSPILYDRARKENSPMKYITQWSEEREGNRRRNGLI